MFSLPTSSRLSPTMIALTRRAGGPRAWMGSLLFVAAVALCIAPTNWQGQLRAWTAAALAPGQRLYHDLLPSPEPINSATPASDYPAARDRATSSGSSIDPTQLQQQVTRLQAALRAARRQADDRAVGTPLIEADWLTVRVLGRQARLRLPPRDQLADGSDQGIAPHDLVAIAVEAHAEPRWLASGEDHRLLPGLLAFHDAAVFGRIIEVGSRTSSVQRVTDSGYRDLVRIVADDAITSGDEASHYQGPQGVLEGTGDSLCRVRMIPVSEPISVGDRVASAGYEGLLDEPIRYGVIVKAERTADTVHWKLWMAPDAYRQRPAQVHVLRTQQVRDPLAPTLETDRERAE